MQALNLLQGITWKERVETVTQCQSFLDLLPSVAASDFHVQSQLLFQSEDHSPNGSCLASVQTIHSHPPAKTVSIVDRYSQVCICICYICVLYNVQYQSCVILVSKVLSLLCFLRFLSIQSIHSISVSIIYQFVTSETYLLLLFINTYINVCNVDNLL